MKYCYDFLNIYNAFQADVKTRYYAIIKCFKCDLGGEYTSNAFFELLASHGIIHHTSCTNTLEQNEVARRKHRHIVETAYTFLLFACVPIEFFGGSSSYFNSLN